MSAVQTPPIHPAHLAARMAMSNRFATRIQMMANDSGRPLAETVADLVTLPADEASGFWTTLATVLGERVPSEATVSATVAILIERS